MSKIAIVYHSGYGHTARQAEAVHAGAAAAGADATLYAVDALTDAHWEELAAADAIVFGAPTYMGSLSAPFKTFMDASSKVWFGQGWKNKLAAGFTNSASQSGDKLNSLVQLAIFAAQQGMLWVSAGMMPGNNSSKGSVDDLNRLGSYIGVMAQSNADQGADAMQDSDLATARELGKRVVAVAAAYDRPRLS
jgi:multimeric flavodoxin WrbA